MTKYDDLIGKLVLLVNRTEKIYQNKKVEYESVCEELNNLESEIEELVHKKEKNDNIIETLSSAKINRREWYDRHIYGIIIGFFAISNFFRYILDIKDTFESFIILYGGTFLIAENRRLRESARVQSVLNEYDLDDVIKENEEIELKIELKSSKLNELLAIKKFLEQICDTNLNKLNERKTLLSEFIGYRNLAYTVAVGNIEKVDYIFDKDERAKNTVMLVREKLEKI